MQAIGIILFITYTIIILLKKSRVLKEKIIGILALFVLLVIFPSGNNNELNNRIYKSNFIGIIIDKEFNTRAKLLTIYYINTKEEKYFSVTEKLYDLSNIGDTIYKIGNSNNCKLHKKDTIYNLEF